MLDIGTLLRHHWPTLQKCDETGREALMGRQARTAPELRGAVARIMRETDVPVAVVASVAGLAAATVARWNREEGWRPETAEPARRDGARLRLGALDGLYRTVADTPPPPEDASLAGDPSVLRGRLHAHIGRQIAAFDAALRGEGAAVIDSPRVLRDLGGLKRLLDDLGLATEGGDGGASGPALHDLPRLRAEIAQRYERRRGDGTAERPAGGPAGAPSPGARP